MQKKRLVQISCLLLCIIVLAILIIANNTTQSKIALELKLQQATINTPTPTLPPIPVLIATPQPTTAPVTVSPSPSPVITIPTVEEIVNNDFDDDELFCLAVVICQETGNGRDEEGVDREQLIRWSVANVVINQCEYYGQTIREVCKRPYNWGSLAWKEIGFSKDNVLSVIQREQVSQMVIDAYQSAWDVLYGGVRVLPKEVLFCAEFIQGDGCCATLYNTAKTPIYFCYGLHMAPWSD